jgi:N-acetylmuramoyl-L-alanine amidase
MHFKRLSALAFALLLGSIQAVSADKPFIAERTINGMSYYPLYDIVAETGVEHSYNPVARRGKLYRREHQAVYLEDCSVMIIDGKIARAKGPVIRHDNEIMIPSSLFEELFTAFFPDRKLVVTKNGASWSAAERPETPPPSGVPGRKTDTGKKAAEHHAPAAAEKIGFIILDAGHGGKDPGAVGKNKLYEKTVTLSVVKKIRSIISKKNPSIKVYLTRDRDVFVELGGRTAFANRKLTNETGGLFVSIHVNASIVPKMDGFETYFLSQTPSNEDARNTAALENNVILIERPGNKKYYDDVYQTEALMITTQIQKESSDLAEAIQDSLSKKIKTSPSRGVKTADFQVLRGSLMPAVLVETGYITNEKELKLLATGEYQDTIARSVADGIFRFLSSYNSK